MKFTKKATPLFLHGAYIVALFCLLGLSVIILWNNSVAWFANNKKVGANGASVTLKDLGITDTYYAAKGADYAANGDAAYKKIPDDKSWAEIFKKLFPGDSVKIKAEYVSASDIDRTLRVCFENLNADGDTPLEKVVTVPPATAGGTEVSEKRYFYLGTQLQVTSVTLDGGTPTTMTNQFLTTPPDNKIYYTSKLTKTYNSINLGTITVKKNTTHTVEFTVEFINYPDIDQNDYQGYGWRETIGETGGTGGEGGTGGTESIENCIRQVVAYVEETPQTP